MVWYPSTTSPMVYDYGKPISTTHRKIANTMFVTQERAHSLIWCYQVSYVGIFQRGRSLSDWQGCALVGSVWLARIRQGRQGFGIYCTSNHTSDDHASQVLIRIEVPQTLADVLLVLYHMCLHISSPLSSHHNADLRDSYGCLECW
jgi:hypothetical protein